MRRAPRARWRARPLAGVPLLVKDLIDTAGIRTTYASRIYADHVPERTAPSVARARGRGRDRRGEGQRGRVRAGASPARTRATATSSTRAIPGASPAARAAATRPRSPPASCRSPSAPTPAARSACLPAACGVVGPQAAPGRDLDRGRLPARAELRHGRPDGAQRGRRGAGARDPHRHRCARAAHPRCPRRRSDAPARRHRQRRDGERRSARRRGSRSGCATSARTSPRSCCPCPPPTPGRSSTRTPPRCTPRRSRAARGDYGPRCAPSSRPPRRDRPRGGPRGARRARRLAHGGRFAAGRRRDRLADARPRSICRASGVDELDIRLSFSVYTQGLQLPRLAGHRHRRSAPRRRATRRLSSPRPSPSRPRRGLRVRRIWRPVRRRNDSR